MAMWPQNRAADLQRCIETVIDSLRGGDMLEGWTALWDIAHSSDAPALELTIETLRAYASSVPTTVAGERATEFLTAFEPTATPSQRRLLPSPEVREHHEAVQIQKHRRAMQRLGVNEGDGLPMWSIYMTRRNKKSWG